MWRDLSISKKIILACGILVAGYFISMAYGFIVGMKTEASLSYVSEVLFPASQQAQSALSAFDDQIKLYKDAVMLGESANVGAAQEKADLIDKTLVAIGKLFTVQNRDAAGVKDVLARHKQFSATAKGIYTQMSAGGGSNDQLMNQAQALSAQTRDIRTLLEQNSAAFSKELKSELEGIGVDTQRQRYTNLATFFVVVVISLVLVTFIILGSVSGPIRQTVTMIRDIAEGEGDLTKRLAVNSGDEVGELARWFNQFITQLEEIIGRIKQTAREMDESTQVVSSESQALSQSTQEQASSVEEVASTIEEMTSSIKQNAQAATDGLDVTRDIVSKAGNSAQISNELMTAMKEISGASKKIGDIISTVNEVAFQTNLLALNAAVEAARAGEHGKGFAVVAEEVRALAQRSSEASRQIKTLIEDTVAKIAAGDTMVVKSGNALAEIREAIDRLANSMEEITASSAEQAVGVDNVNKAVSQIDTVTQQNAATVEQLASMAEKLSAEAENLAQTVGQFKVAALD